MFLVGDSISDRHRFIERFLDGEDASVAILLSAADFERSLKRGILALGRSPTKEIKLKVFSGRFHGLDAFKKGWKSEVTPRYEVELADDVVKGWSKFTRAFDCRNSIIHGATKKMSPDYASTMSRRILAASSEIHRFAATHGKNLDARIVRRKPNE